MLKRPWTIAQFAIAAVLLVLSLIGVIGTLAFDNADLTFTFAGAIQSFGVFPGLILSLGLNGMLMGLNRAPAPNLGQRVFLIIEFALIALLLVFHFFQDSDAYTFGFAVATWPLVIIVAIVIAILAIVQLASGRVSSTAPIAPPAPTP